MIGVILSFFIFVLVLINPSYAFARYHPLTVSNNKFGIHISDSTDLNEAANAVNSSGGDWGYVTVVITDQDRNTAKWQSFFDASRTRHIIPLVRLATHFENGAWTKPRPEDATSWSTFLNNLNWPIENRYVILFNEPNHAKEWSNQVSPREYAYVIEAFAKELKNTNSDFFILNAGFDQAAANGTNSLEETSFLLQMNQSVDNIFSYLDGWVSHSYPNPAFSGSPTSQGKASISGFRWEQEFLQKNFSITPLPIFITETGWARANDTFQEEQRVADNFSLAAQTVWSDNQVIAVTPFTLNFPGAPFAPFSWRRTYVRDTSEEATYYLQYRTWKALPKIAGLPKQRINFEIISFPKTLVQNEEATVSVTFRNTGQSIWGEREEIINIQVLNSPQIINPLPVKTHVFPSQETAVSLALPAIPQTGQYSLSFSIISSGSDSMELKNQQITVVPPLSLLISASAGLKQKNQEFDLSIYDQNNRFVMNIPTIITDEKGTSPTLILHKMIPNNMYRLVLHKPYFLSQEILTTIQSDTNHIIFPPLLPLDADGDGTLSAQDIVETLRHPQKTLEFLLP